MLGWMKRFWVVVVIVIALIAAVGVVSRLRTFFDSDKPYIGASQPADAIKPDTEPGLEKWLEVNSEYAKSWPNITQKKDSPADAKEMEGVEGKFEKYFSPNPGTGD